MTEGQHNYEDDYLVRVRAQVMNRDESTEGWLPLAGGGLANVSIRKRPRLPPDIGGYEYIIYGQRISDQTIILSCVINRELQYFKVMPTFHHWRAGKQRNGLTFQTAADARAFDKGIIRAYDELIDGEDDVFMTLDLPLETKESRSNSEGSGSHKSGEQQSIHYISCEKPLLSIQANMNTTEATPGDNYSYVQLTAVHDYNYPVVDEPVSSVINTRRESACSLKKRCGLKEGLTIKARLHCRYCQEIYSEEWNRKGACDFAPDCFETSLETISGMQYARCMLYHCMKDSEGETAAHPCQCSKEVGCTRRWIGITLLSFLIPCLWCYPPLKACHWIGVTCGVCGGKHKPQV